MIKTLKDRILDDVGPEEFEKVALALDLGPNIKGAMIDYLFNNKTPIQIQATRGITKQQLHSRLRTIYKYYFGKPYEKH